MAMLTVDGVEYAINSLGDGTVLIAFAFRGRRVHFTVRDVPELIQETGVAFTPMDVGRHVVKCFARIAAAYPAYLVDYAYYYVNHLPGRAPTYETRLSLKLMGCILDNDTAFGPPQKFDVIEVSLTD